VIALGKVGMIGTIGINGMIGKVGKVWKPQDLRTKASGWKDLT
jgi:hypothetical protein